MTYKDNTPTFNSGNRKVVNFKDFIQHSEEEKEELKDIKKNFTKNAKEIGLQQHKYKFNKVTHKMDDLVEDEVDDKLEVFEKNTVSVYENNNFDVKGIEELENFISQTHKDAQIAAESIYEDRQEQLLHMLKNILEPGSVVTSGMGGVFIYDSKGNRIMKNLSNLLEDAIWHTPYGTIGFDEIEISI